MHDALAQKDRMLGWSCYRLDRLPQGLVLVHLRGDDSKVCGGKLLLDVQRSIVNDAAPPKPV